MREYSAATERLLFHKNNWFNTKESWIKKLTLTIDSINGDELLNTSSVDLVRHLT